MIRGAPGSIPGTGIQFFLFGYFKCFDILLYLDILTPFQVIIINLVCLYLLHTFYFYFLRIELMGLSESVSEILLHLRGFT